MCIYIYMYIYVLIIIVMSCLAPVLCQMVHNDFETCITKIAA